ncbi:hypothetical protein HanRHA438_Chr11g0522381 [Helianthus annuus]|nr:hypothetical protein HanRHA438_Chr11g0522381 [Helianthus annuus]
MVVGGGEQWWWEVENSGGVDEVERRREEEAEIVNYSYVSYTYNIYMGKVNMRLLHI